MANDDKDDNVRVRQTIADGQFLRPTRPRETEVDADSQFVFAASYADLSGMKLMFENGANVNFQEPMTGATALHFAAAIRARDLINWLAKRDGIDFLIKDRKGRLPSALAFEIAEDPVIGRYLAQKQSAQARAQGIDMATLYAR